MDKETKNTTEQEQKEPLTKEFLIDLYSHYQAIQKENKEKIISKFKIA